VVKLFWEVAMLDPKTVAVLRAILDELCETASRPDAAKPSRITSDVLKAALEKGSTIDTAATAGRRTTSSRVPTMWR